jgi:hypothetical protein
VKANERSSHREEREKEGLIRTLTLSLFFSPGDKQTTRIIEEIGFEKIK